MGSACSLIAVRWGSGGAASYSSGRVGACGLGAGPGQRRATNPTSLVFCLRICGRQKPEIHVRKSGSTRTSHHCQQQPRGKWLRKKPERKDRFLALGPGLATHAENARILRTVVRETPLPSSGRGGFHAFCQVAATYCRGRHQFVFPRSTPLRGEIGPLLESQNPDHSSRPPSPVALMRRVAWNAALCPSRLPRVDSWASP